MGFNLLILGSDHDLIEHVELLMGFDLYDICFHCFTQGIGFRDESALREFLKILFLLFHDVFLFLVQAYFDQSVEVRSLNAFFILVISLFGYNYLKGFFTKLRLKRELWFHRPAWLLVGLSVIRKDKVFLETLLYLVLGFEVGFIHIEKEKTFTSLVLIKYTLVGNDLRDSKVLNTSQ